MDDIEKVEVIYCGRDWHEDGDLNYLSDVDSDGYSSGGDYNNF